MRSESFKWKSVSGPEDRLKRGLGINTAQTISSSQRSPDRTSGEPDRIRLTTDLRTGVDSRLHVRDMIAELGASRAFIVCGHHFADGALGKELRGVLGTAYVGTVICETDQGSLDELRRGTEGVAKAGADILLAIGGGSVIGLAKSIAKALVDPSPYEALAGPFDLVGREVWGETKWIPIIAMPTNAGSGSEVNQYGSVFDPGTRRKIRASDYRALPRITVLDPVLTVSLNVLQTASTGANALSHCFEAVYSRARHPLSTAFARQGASLIGAALPRCVAEPDNLKAREDQLMGSVLSSLGFSNSMLGLNSAFGHSLGAVGGMTVALGNYIMLPISLRHNAAYAPREIVEVGTEMGLAKPGTPASQAAAAQVADEVGRWLHAMAGELRLRDFVPGGRAGLVEVSIHCVPDVCLPYNPGPQPDQSTLLRLLEQAW